MYQIQVPYVQIRHLLYQRIYLVQLFFKLRDGPAYEADPHSSRESLPRLLFDYIVELFEPLLRVALIVV